MSALQIRPPLLTCPLDSVPELASGILCFDPETDRVDIIGEGDFKFAHKRFPVNLFESEFDFALSNRYFAWAGYTLHKYRSYPWAHSDLILILAGHGFTTRADIQMKTETEKILIGGHLVLYWKNRLMCGCTPISVRTLVSFPLPLS